MPNPFEIADEADAIEGGRNSRDARADRRDAVFDKFVRVLRKRIVADERESGESEIRERYRKFR